MSSSFHVRERARRVALYRSQMTVVVPQSLGYVEQSAISRIDGTLDPSCEGIVYEPYEQRHTAPSRVAKMAAVLGGASDRSNRED